MRRNGIAALLAALPVVSAGCGPWAHELRSVDVASIPRDKVLVLGHVHLRWMGRRPTEGIWLDASDGEALPLPPSGEVAWVMSRASKDVWLKSFDIPTRPRATTSWRIHLGTLERPLLQPAGIDAPVVYVGDIVIRVERKKYRFKKEKNPPNYIGMKATDAAEDDFRHFVDENPILAGRLYYHVLRKARLRAPPAPQAAIPAP
jgi:hypothetical protein